MPSSRDAATTLAKMGFKVFRTDAFTCRPLRAGWIKYASSDIETVRKEFTGPDGASVSDNVALLCGDGILVLDVDVKNGQPGELSLAQLVREGLSEDTFTIRTASGGKHLFYRVDAKYDYKGLVNWRPGLDVRSYHNYVNTIGTSKNIAKKGEAPVYGGYEIVNNVPMLELPAKFSEPLIRGAAGALKNPVAVDTKYEDDGSIARAIAFLEKHESGPGQHHDDLLKAANTLFDFGITPSRAADLIEGYWPSADAIDDVAYQVDSMARTRLAKPDPGFGQIHPNRYPIFDTFVRVPLDPKDDAPVRAARKTKFYTLADCMAAALEIPEEALVEGLLDKHALSEVYGGSNTGKTFILLSLFAAVAAGEPWAGRATCQTLCIYFALEGGTGILKRGAALAAAAAGQGKDLPLYIVPAPLDLRNGDAGLKGMLEDIRAIEALSGMKCGLIGLDTMSRALAGGDENSSVDMGKLVQSFTAVQNATGAHLTIVHHTGKNEASGARGHSLMKGAVDTEIYIRRGARDEVGFIEATKQRDMELGDVFEFRLEDVWFGPNVAGEKVKSARAVVKPGAAGVAGVEIREPLTAIEQHLVDVLAEQAGAGEDEAGVTAADWLSALRLQALIGGPDFDETNFRSRRAVVKRKGWIREPSARKWALN